MRLSDRKWTWCFFLAALLVAAGMFAVGLRNIPPSTDESIIALQAKHIFHPPTDPEIRESMHPKPLFFRFPLLFMAQPYLFPIEAYIAAVPHLVLPQNAFGVRAVPFALSLAALVISFLVMRNFGSVRDVWPGLLLLVFPSAYVLMMQFGYALPGYPSHLLFVVLAIWLLQRYARNPGIVPAGLCGVVCAAALAGQMMAAPLILMCGVLILVIGRGWARLGHAAVYGVLAVTGWAPIWLAQQLYAGAHTAVAGTWHWREALERVWSPALDFVLPVASGIKSTVFPDNMRHIELLPWLTAAWPYLWMALLGAGGLLLLMRVWNRRLNLSGDQKVVAVVFVGISIAAVILFVFSRRSHSHTYRYLVNAAWAIPFIVAYVHSEAPWRWLRRVVAVFAVGLALFNAATIGMVMKEWSTPRFAADEAMFFDAGPAIAYLEEADLTRVYAGYGLAYRLTYLTDERIIAAQYYNERFHGWPMPYKSAVDAADRIAYVLAPQFAVTAERFAEDMEEMGVSMRTVQAGDLAIFYDFHYPESERGGYVTPPGLRAETSHQPEAAYALINGVYEYRWRSHRAQEPGMWVRMEWDEPIRLKKIYMYYNYYHQDRARALDVYARVDGEWRLVREGVPQGMDAHEWDRDRPIYGNQFQRIEVETVRANGLRIEIAEAEPGRDWTIGEIRLWGRAEEEIARLRVP